MKIDNEIRRIRLSYLARDVNYGETNPYDYFNDDYAFTIFSEELALLRSFKLLGYNVRTKLKILDVGCGGGTWGAKVLTWLPESSYYGIDLAKNRLDRAKSIYNQNVVNACAHQLPFYDASFDLVYHITLFSSLPVDLWHITLSEISRVLRPNGRFIWCDVNTSKMGMAKKNIASMLSNVGLSEMKFSKQVLNFDLLWRLKLFGVPFPVRLTVALLYKRYWVVGAFSKT